MPRKIKDVTKDYLVNVGLPNHGQTYTVISHQSIIDYAYAELANQGFGIVDEEYRSTHDGQIAQGIYKLQYGTDPEMNLMFAWTNSYNKQIRFKCATGGYVTNNRTVMLAGDMGSYARKHTGTADADVIASMQAQITNAMMYYNQLIADKEVMKTIELSTRKQAELLGVLFAEYEILTTEQASTIRQQMDKPSYFYNGGKNTLWAFYNHCTVALQQSHPRTWMEDQRMLHWVISNEFDLTTPATAAAIIEIVDPLENNYGEPENQTNLLVQIAEVEAQYPVTESDAFIGMEEDEAMMREAWMDDVEAGEHGEDEAPSVEIPEPEVIQYTDPVGNTFEAPVVEEKPTGKLPSDIQARLNAFNATREVEESSILTEEEAEDDLPFTLGDDEDESEPTVEEEVEAIMSNDTDTEVDTDLDFTFDLTDDDNEEESLSTDGDEFF